MHPQVDDPLANWRVNYVRTIGEKSEYISGFETWVETFRPLSLSTGAAKGPSVFDVIGFVKNQSLGVRQIRKPKHCADRSC